MSTTRILVLGGGFGGIHAALHLEKALRADPDVQITLVSRDNFFLFTPMLHEVAASDLDITHIVSPIGPLILPELGEKLGAYAQRKLAARGVEIMTNAKVASVDELGVTLEDGRRIPSQLVVWTAGTSPHPLIHDLPCRLDRGRIVVDDALAVPGWPGVWALGDCAVVPNGRTGKPHPPTAQHALREAKTVATNPDATHGELHSEEAVAAAIEVKR